LELDDTALARLCADVEHHPDNVAPAIYGGAVLAVPGPEGRLTVAPLEVHGSLVFVFAVPDFAVETEQARAALPSTVSHRTAAKAVATTMARVWGALDVTAETFVIERPASRYDVTSLTQETLPCPSR